MDTSLSQAQVLRQERTASASFATDVLRDGQDTSFLIHFDHEVELLQDLTTSRQKMVSALQSVEPASYQRQQQPQGGGSGPYGGHGRHGGGPGGGTLLYDSIYLAGDELLQKQHGRKAIVVLTDGVDHGSKMSLERAIETAQRADTMVYSIYFEGQEGGDHHLGMGGGWGGHRRGGWPGGGYPGGGGRSGPTSEDGKKILERLSRETGGKMFAVSKKLPVEQIYRRIEDDLRNQYNLGYTPDRAADAGPDYRHIHVTAKSKDLTVQAREGYYPARQVNARLTQ